MADLEPIVVCVDEDIIDLIPVYMENRQRELEMADGALADGNFEALRVMGHQLKGSGGGYGMDRLTEIGQSLEEAAKAEDAETTRQTLDELKSYLDRVRVVPE